DAHRDNGKRLVAHADEKLTAFMELEAARSRCQRHVNGCHHLRQIIPFSTSYSRANNKEPKTKLRTRRTPFGREPASSTTGKSQRNDQMTPRKSKRLTRKTYAYMAPSSAGCSRLSTGA